MINWEFMISPYHGEVIYLSPEIENPEIDDIDLALFKFPGLQYVEIQKENGQYILSFWYTNFTHRSFFVKSVIGDIATCLLKNMDARYERY